MAIIRIEDKKHEEMFEIEKIIGFNCVDCGAWIPASHVFNTQIIYCQDCGKAHPHPQHQEMKNE